MNFIRRLGFILVAAAALQLPLFVDQYEMRLNSHIAEIEIVASQLETMARRCDKSVPAYIQALSSSKEQEARLQGQFLNDIIARKNKLLGCKASLAEIHPILRPFALFGRCDYTIASESIRDFRPGFVVNSSSIFWMGLCLFFWYIFLNNIISYRSRCSSEN